MREQLSGRISVLVGHSGVGKSTLVNALVPGADRAIGGVNAVTGRGRHTSTSAVALELPGGGWVIDTPGIRSFGLAHVDLDRGPAGFPDLEPGTEECPRGCTHDERTAPSTPGSRPARPTRTGWPRCAACCAAATNRRRPARPRFALLAGVRADGAAPDGCGAEVARDASPRRGRDAASRRETATTLT